jgi:hypothetical protein
MILKGFLNTHPNYKLNWILKSKNSVTKYLSADFMIVNRCCITQHNIIQHYDNINHSNTLQNNIEHNHKLMWNSA